MNPTARPRPQDARAAGTPDRSSDGDRKLAECREYATRQIARLTPRQHDILTLILAGSPNKNIAVDIGISQRTVENHRAEIMRRMGVKSIPAMARLAMSAGWTWPDEPLVRCVFNHKSPDFGPSDASDRPECQTVAGYRGELARARQAEFRLREIVAADEILIMEQNQAIDDRTRQVGEADHRLANHVQVVISLLSLQGRASHDAATSATLLATADLIAAIAHERLPGPQPSPYKNIAGRNHSTFMDKSLFASFSPEKEDSFLGIHHQHQVI